MTNCPHCNSEIQSGWKACPACGERLPELPECPSCGAELQQGWKACPTCGNRVDDQRQAAALNINDDDVDEINHRLNVGQPTQVGTGESRIVSFPRAILLAFQNYFNFRGRSARAEVWWFLLFINAALIPLSIVDNYMGWTVELRRQFGLLSTLFKLATTIPSVSLWIRRLHDINRSGWWLLSIIPPLVWAFKRGNDGPNRYGPDPRPPASETNPRHKAWITIGLLVIFVTMSYGLFEFFATAPSPTLEPTPTVVTPSLTPSSVPTAVPPASAPTPDPTSGVMSSQPSGYKTYHDSQGRYSINIPHSWEVSDQEPQLELVAGRGGSSYGDGIDPELNIMATKTQPVVYNLADIVARHIDMYVGIGFFESQRARIILGDVDAEYVSFYSNMEVSAQHVYAFAFGFLWSLVCFSDLTNPEASVSEDQCNEVVRSFRFTP